MRQSYISGLAMKKSVRTVIGRKRPGATSPGMQLVGQSLLTLVLNHPDSDIPASVSSRS